MKPLRKLVHMGGAAFAFLALYDARLSLIILLTGVAVFLLMERFKAYLGPPVQSLYKDDELWKGASEPLWYLVSIAALLLISLFALPGICYASIIVLTVGDGVAGVVGPILGKHKLPGSKKSWEGSLAGFIAAAAVGFIFAGPLAIAGAAAGMAVEAYSVRFENLAVVAASFVAMAILSLFL
jgi:dolichol kinase